MADAELICVFNQLVYVTANEGIFAPSFTGAGASYKALLGNRQSWVPNSDDDFISTAVGIDFAELGDASYARQAVVLGTPANTDADDAAYVPADVVDWGALVGGETYDTILLAMDTGDTSTSWLAAAFNCAGGPYVTDGSGVTFTPNVTALFAVSNGSPS